MRKGSVLPLILIIIAFLLVPLAYWYFVYKGGNSQTKGARTGASDNGVYVIINSLKGTWELNTYLCKDKSSCLASLTSGDKMDTKSGGKTSGYEVVLEQQSSWKNYEYLKFYVKEGWGAPEREFTASGNSFIGGIFTEGLPAVNSTYNVVVVPMKSVLNSFSKVAEFSD